MAGLEDVFKSGNLGTGLAIVVGAAVLSPIVLPVLRPVAKTLIKAGIVAFEQGRAAYAELSERTGDMVAEARHELESERERPSGHAPASGHVPASGHAPAGA